MPQAQARARGSELRRNAREPLEPGLEGVFSTGGSLSRSGDYSERRTEQR